MPGPEGDALWDFLEPGPPPAAPPGPPGPLRTYVQGFDEALAGGIPRGSIVVLVGGPGAMKSLFSFWTLYNNARQEGRKGLYLTLEQRAASLQRQMELLGMDVGAVEDRLTLVDVATLRGHGFDGRVDWVDFILQVARRAREQGAEVLVLDSITALEGLARFENPRHAIFRFYEGLRGLGLTAFMISERSADEAASGGGRRAEDFLADGIIEFRFHPLSEYEVQRRIRCVKMRGCRHETSSLALLWDEGALRVARAIGQQGGRESLSPAG